MQPTADGAAYERHISEMKWREMVKDEKLATKSGAKGSFSENYSQPERKQLS